MQWLDYYHGVAEIQVANKQNVFLLYYISLLTIFTHFLCDLFYSEIFLWLSSVEYFG